MNSLRISHTDELVVYYFLGFVVLMLLLNSFFVWLKNSKKKDLLSKTESVDLGNYIFNFNMGQKEKKFSYFTKTVSISLCILLVLIPLYELIEVLKPQYYFVWSCFGPMPL